MGIKLDVVETGGPPLSPEDIADLGLKDQVVKVLQTIYDPEIPINIYDLGLIYDILLESDGEVRIRMTLTSPSCPVAESLPLDVERKVRSLPDVRTAEVDLVWDPPFCADDLPFEVKLQLGLL